jgi:hypothetical protein
MTIDEELYEEFKSLETAGKRLSRETSRLLAKYEQFGKLVERLHGRCLSAVNHTKQLSSEQPSDNLHS